MGRRRCITTTTTRSHGGKINMATARETERTSDGRKFDAKIMRLHSRCQYPIPRQSVASQVSTTHRISYPTRKDAL